MEVTTNGRNFEVLTHEVYPPGPQGDDPPRLAQESSAICFDYPDAANRPGTSYLWIGEHHHLNREQVAEFVARLQSWLSGGRLSGGAE